MNTKNICLNCGHEWNSKTDCEDCPKCKETYYLKRIVR